MHLLILCFALNAVHTDPGEIPRLQVATDKKALPLEHTSVRAAIEGNAARVEVTQRYRNTYTHPIEAIYVFPLPENSAVDDMKMVIGDRVVRAEIKKRDDAKRTYDQAKQQGKTAALLEQERPNIFTQSVANIAPGNTIEVVVSYLQDLTYDGGEYEFVFPMVVGPRFNPPGTDKVTQPAYLGEGTRSGHDISIEVTAHAGLPIKGAEVPTHDVQLTQDSALHVKLSPKDTVPNRDFVLHYRVDGKAPEAAALAANGYLTLLVQPPTLDLDKVVGNRELIFVVDVSGSMHGVPLSMCKDAMREALQGLRPTDTFNILAFSGWTGQAFAAPRAANEASIAEGLKFITALQAGGGTYMADAIKAALSPELTDRNRYVFFMTDGYVGNEAQILAATETYVKAQKGKGLRSKVFGFGVGSSVNRYLLDGLGKSGEGLTVYASTREDPTLAVNKFYRYIDASILEDVSIDWNGLPVTEVYPRALPDLFASHPLTVHARYEGAGTGKIFIRGTKAGKRIELPVEVQLGASSKDTALASLWARSKIGDLQRDLWTGEQANTVQAITELGLGYRLVTPYTSFVAVDRDSSVNGASETILQPAHAPEGVNMEMAGVASRGRSTGFAISGYGSGGGGVGSGSIGGSLGFVGKRVRSAPVATLSADVKEEKDGTRTAPASAAEPSKAKVQASEWTLTGALTLGQIQQAFAALDKCFEKKPVTLTLRFVISPAGVVQSPRMTGAQNDCVINAVKAWAFPTAAQITIVSRTWTIR